MTGRMPRGALPTPRSQFAASEPYRPDPAAAPDVPTGVFPAPNAELAAAAVYKDFAAPESFLAWPVRIGAWDAETAAHSLWSEEAFAKACADPPVFVPPDALRRAAQACGGGNFAAFMRSQGFSVDGKAYLDGRFLALDWTDAAVLNSAIARLGPVKIGLASAAFAERGPSGWAICGLPAGQPEDRYASLFGYGPLATLVDLFGRRGIAIDPPPAMPTGLCYAMFLAGTIGVVDRQSLVNVTGEAWVRNPTTLVRDPG